LSLSQAAMLMKVVANNSRSTVQLIEIELSKAYLYRALRCKDSDSDSIYCLANVYLAVLYYITGQYQTAIDHCKLVTRSQDHSQCSSHVVQGELLPKIDNDIDNVLGLSVFYQYVRTAALNRQVTIVKQHVSVFTTELFAHYLSLRYLLAEKCPMPKHMLAPASEIRQYRKRFYELSDVFITDVLVSNLLSRTQYTAHDQEVSLYGDQTKPVMSCQLDTSELVELLQQSAVEHLTIFRQLQTRESVHGFVTTDFEALYTYKCGEYQRCLQLSTHNVRTLMVDKRMSVIFSCPEFIQLMDNNIASLVGLTLLVDMSSREDPEHFMLSQLSLSLYLMSQCQMKLHHTATSLAQTLDYVKVAWRDNLCPCLIDQSLLKLTESKLLRYLVGTAMLIFLLFNLQTWT